MSYLSIASYGYLFQMVALVLCVILRASGDSVLPLKATAAAVLVNGVFNYIFIFGKLGLAPMGVRAPPSPLSSPRWSTRACWSLSATASATRPQPASRR